MCRRVAIAAFPIVLWFIASFAFLGDWGRWNDDYFHDLRDPVTHDGLAGPMALQSGTAFRPLFYAIVPPLITNVGEAMWIPHAIGALVHGLVCGWVYVLSRRLGLTWRGASLAVLIVLVYPPHWQAVLWASAMPTALATAGVLGLALIVDRAARGEGTPSGWLTLGCVALGLAIPCLNEQPAACVPALAVLMVARGVRPERHSPRSQPSSEDARVSTGVDSTLSPRVPCLRRAMTLNGALLGIAIYVAWFWLTASSTQRGGVATLIGLNDVAPRVAVVAERAWFHMRFRDMGIGPIVQMVEVIAQHRVVASIYAAALVVAGLAWIRRWSRLEPQEARDAVVSPDAASVGFPCRAIALGLGWFACSWIPLVMIRGQGVESRLLYPGWPGLAIALAAALDALGQRGREGRSGQAIRTATGVIVAAVSLLGGFMFVGIQSALRERARLDVIEGQRLAELAPRTPPGSIVLPLAVLNTSTHTGVRAFDTMMYGALRRPWASASYLPKALRRKDLASGWVGDWDRWTPLIDSFSSKDGSEGLLYDNPKLWIEKLAVEFPTNGHGATILPANRILAFVIDEAGQVRLVERVEFERVAGDPEPVRIELPQVAGDASLAEADRAVVRFAPRPARRDQGRPVRILPPHLPPDRPAAIMQGR